MKHIHNHFNPYPIARESVYAKKGMVATTQPLAAEAGLEMLKKGGNAIDAAIAAAACLTVVEPTSNGIGGDAFALVWINGKLHGLNGSGRSPEDISIEAVKEKGYDAIPKFGWMPVTVPGVPRTWAALSQRFGKLPLKETLKPAIKYAREGFPVSPTLARFWKRAYQMYKKQEGYNFSEWFRIFAPNGRAPKIGEIWKSPDHAVTLEKIAETDAASFYEGELAGKIVTASKKADGFLTKEDLEKYEVEWVDPIKVNYRGYDIWEIPPNGQGIIALQALNILKAFEFTVKESVNTYHKQIEAIKLAFEDGKQHITEESRMRYTTEQLLSDQYAAQRRALIQEEAILPEAGDPSGSGTVYLATADEEGNMVSFIQSNYMGFGSGVVIPGTGITMQNRGYDFSMDETHVNALEGGKKTFHTIIPGFVTKDNEAVGPFSVMGGFMQPQAHVQIVMNTVDFGLHPQAALDAPRWQWMKEKRIEVEHRFSYPIAQGLRQKGHDIRMQLEPNSFGRGQIIWRDPETGVLAGGTESRADGHIAVW
ncbi:gamma-glutamyltransferase [Oceanobacillus sp. CFH 90083]|uniref:gamma-glutamyltransferase n=1 Tax=Oceanobacillus sp. CFH 90083 TaxID=2592336 RepID=UPI00128C8AA7|nr:gamma-glutamyltransferase [Oceanobacillus sp. CFH 90083]